MSYPIRTEHLSKSFRGAPALTDLNLTVAEGAIYGLIGQSGAGKSTTIKILMNVIRAASGRAEVLGVDSAKLSARELTSIGYVSEDPQPPGWMTVLYFLSYLKPFYPTWDDSRAQALLREFNLPLSRKLSHLSRGMRMKAVLTSVLAYRPKLLILDEPFAGLDPLVRDELTQGMLTSAEHATTLISSHDLTEIESFVSHVGYLEHGQLQFSEEMTKVTTRFREIEVTADEPLVFPRSIPAAWMNAECSDNCARWVDTHFEDPRSVAEIQHVFGDFVQIEVKPLTLREIFVTLAKASRNEV